MIPVDFSSILNTSARGEIEFCAPEFDPSVLSFDTDLALIRFPCGMHIDVRWDKETRGFYVILFGNNFADVLAERECSTILDLKLTVRDLSNQVHFALLDRQPTFNVSFGAVFFKHVTFVASSDTDVANPITYDDKSFSHLQPIA